MDFDVRGEPVRRKMTVLGAFVFPPFENRKGWGTRLQGRCANECPFHYFHRLVLPRDHWPIPGEYVPHDDDRGD